MPGGLMPRLTAILGISVAILFISCGYSSRVSAQVASRPGPTKLDEFGRLGHCDLTARLDNFAFHLQETTGGKGYVITYGPESEVGLGNNVPERLKDYLINVRGLRADGFNFIYGGRNVDLTQPKIELWIAPKGAQPLDRKSTRQISELSKAALLIDPLTIISNCMA
jgi:hypothetical protein